MMSEDDKILVLQQTQNLWQKYLPKNETIFITGATGFFGKNLLDSFIYINEQLKLNIQILVLTRNKQKFLEINPRYNLPFFKFIEGNTVDFIFPQEPIDFIIHAANDFNENESNLNINERPVILGAKRVLEFAAFKKVKAILHTSSGAVYGSVVKRKNIEENQFIIKENFDCINYYTDNKRYIEYLCEQYFINYNVPSKIARCFAFVGTYLPLNEGYAIGNFIKNFIDNKPIIIKGDGLVCRSYLYTADLCIWLFKILFTGKICNPYNVGSDEFYTLKEVAQKVAEFKKPAITVEVLNKNNNVIQNWYIPSIKKCKKELGLEVYTNLDKAIEKTINNYKIQGE